MGGSEEGAWQGRRSVHILAMDASTLSHVDASTLSHGSAGEAANGEGNEEGASLADHHASSNGRAAEAPYNTLSTLKTLPPHHPGHAATTAALRLSSRGGGGGGDLHEDARSVASSAQFSAYAGEKGREGEEEEGGRRKEREIFLFPSLGPRLTFMHPPPPPQRRSFRSRTSASGSCGWP